MSGTRRSSIWLVIGLLIFAGCGGEQSTPAATSEPEKPVVQDMNIEPPEEKVKMQ